MKTIDLFLTVLRAVEAKVKATVLADSVGGEGLLPCCLQGGTPRTLCSHGRGQKDRGSSNSPEPFHTGIDPFAESGALHDLISY